MLEIIDIICSIMVLTALLFLVEYFLWDNLGNEARRGEKIQSTLLLCLHIIFVRYRTYTRLLVKQKYRRNFKLVQYAE